MFLEAPVKVDDVRMSFVIVEPLLELCSIMDHLLSGVGEDDTFSVGVQLGCTKCARRKEGVTVRRLIVKIELAL